MLSRQTVLRTFGCLFVLLGVILAGCGSSQPASSGTSSNSTQPVTLTWFMWTGSTQEVQAWEYDASLVTRQYPWIHIKFETTTFPEYWTKLESEAASGTLPDIISLQSQHTPGFASSFVPLNSFIKSSNFDISAFNSTIINGLTYQGSLRALPYDFGPYMIFYNKNLFQKYHVPLPTAGWTYAQFLQDAQMMTHGNDYGFIATPFPDSWLPFALSDGANYLTSNGQLDLTNPQLVAAFQNYAKLVYQYHVSPTITATEAINTPSLWQAGHIGMVIDGPWDLINDKAVVKFQFGIAPMPAGSKGSITFVAGSGFGISTTSQHQADDWKAISVLTGATAEQYLASAGRAFSARTAQQTYWYQNAVPGAQAAMNETLATSVPYLTTANWNEVSTLLAQDGLQVLDGQVSAATVLKNVQTQANSQ